MNIPQLLKGYKETELGIIPNNWKVVALCDYSKKITDGEHLTPKRSSNGYYLLSARNILNGHLNLSDVDFVDASEYQRIRQRCNPEVGDVLISCSGSVGRVAIVPQGLECVMVRSAALIKPNPMFLSGQYLQYFLQSKIAQDQISASLNQAAQANLFLNHIERLLVALPPTKAEQEAIAKALNDADALIESLEQLIAKKRQIKQGAMQELLTGKRRLPGFSGEWKVERLDAVAEIDPENLGSTTPNNYGFNYISLEDIEVGFLTGYSEEKFGSSPSRARRQLRAGDILVATVRPNLKSHLLFTMPQSNWVCSTGFSVVRCRKKEANSRYIFFHFFSDYVNKQIESLLTGSNYPAISGKDVAALEMPLPKPHEQMAVAAILSDMDAEIFALEAKLSKARQIKQGMMQELLTGRIRLV
ncbi:restriction endonuclease subunit S [Gloeobacter morelensis]|uniref:Restriction endonuclease subunit S n=1 Tax=Gloeobacter morelensis MG652769 TaxID=2781736 RepID=A0ABY3PNC1_9CYAN|nr:restriction endonuclease subunit S [Gloeobacter morelensis]UFP95115.1 restriction endonuclease subunit S [Gloeobacter morelensis MG652769]